MLLFFFQSCKFRLPFQLFNQNISNNEFYILQLYFFFPLIMNIIIPSYSKIIPKQNAEETNLSDFETKLLNPSSDLLDSFLNYYI